MRTRSAAGYFFAIAAYVIWGLFPIYWKWLAHVHALEILAHRILWTVPFTAVVLMVIKRWGALAPTLRDRKQLRLLIFSTCLISINWGVYIWAVNHDRVVQASLGYFLTPLLSVFLGVILFHERLRTWQWVVVSLALAGVVNQLLFAQTASWVSLSVGLSFAGYGALRKLVSCDSATGLLIETALLSPVAIAWMWWLYETGNAAFWHSGVTTDLLLILGGVVTGTPLLLYVAGAKRLPLTTMGLIFYLTPTLQFLLGITVYDEPVDMAQMITFGLIWTGLALHAVEERLRARRAISPEVA